LNAAGVMDVLHGMTLPLGAIRAIRTRLPSLAEILM